LLAADADVNIKDVNGDDALTIAKNRNLADMIWLLQYT
jgi:hypothetical protein